jgi:hypothetical protein
LPSTQRPSATCSTARFGVFNVIQVRVA